jgi:hypothetical protein
LKVGKLSKAEDAEENLADSDELEFSQIQMPEQQH